jgi:hypothetical protein
MPISPKVKHIAKAFIREHPELTSRGIYLLCCIDEFYVVGFCFSASSRGSQYRYIHTVIDCLTLSLDPEVIPLSYGYRITIGNQELYDMSDWMPVLGQTASQILLCAKQFMRDVQTGDLCHQFLIKHASNFGNMDWLESAIASSLWHGRTSEAEVLQKALEDLATSPCFEFPHGSDEGDCISTIELEMHRSRLLHGCIQRTSERFNLLRSGGRDAIRQHLKNEAKIRLMALKCESLCDRRTT